MADKAEEQKTEEKLTKQAEAAAAAAPVVVASERKKQVTRQQPSQKSEAETHYLIDEQLRQVGWEVNTEELHYAKGCRPTKGHNMAIAEWPTDSTVGKQGYADFVLFVGLQLVAIY